MTVQAPTAGDGATSPGDRPDLTVILVNWNSLELTSAALASIKEQTQGITYEVIVVDNGTTADASVTELPVRFPWVRLIANPDNRGYSKANNQGIAQARARYTLLLNTDTLQTGNALGGAVRYMDAHADVGALGILHLNNDARRTVQPSFYPFPNPWREALALVGLGRGRPPAVGVPPPEQDVDWLCGSFLLMRRECLEQVGGLDERFFVYGEDIDWCLRARAAGWKVRFWPGAALVHLGSASRPFIRDKTFMHFRSHLTYIRKNHSVPAAAFYYVAMGLRLTASTGWQVLRCLAGRGTLADVRERYRRQVQFLFLRPGRTGLTRS
jgi:GT2 family glycosyltransferase